MSQFDFKDTCTGTYNVPSDIAGEKGKFFYKDANNGAGLIVSDYANYFTNGQWTSYDSYYDDLIKSNPTGQAMKFVTSAAGANTPATTDITTTGDNDKKLIDRLTAEYCYFRVRYNKYLDTFIGEATKQSGADNDKANALLANLIELNEKLNAFALYVDWYNSNRAGIVNARTTAMNKLNDDIQKDRPKNIEAVKSDEAVLNTRKEMVRYTKEKNNAITNQISLWASLNVVAIAIIFHLYRTL